MLQFHPIGLSDKPWIDERVFAFGSQSADFNFGSMFMWDGKYRQLVCDSNERLIALAHAGEKPIFPFPVGTGDLGAAVEAMREYAEKNGFPFVIRGVEDAGWAELERLFPGKFYVTEDRDFSDYIYDAEKLASLAGKKLHAKRNFINRFEAAHEWRFEPLEKRHFPACRALLERWDAAAPEDEKVSVRAEHRAIFRGLDNYDELGLIGGALFAEGEIIAFSIGERISGDTVDVHFEKAIAEIDGAYPMINREFSRHVLECYPQVKYLNREDDMGLDSLRRSKLSYHPEYILMKYTAHWR
jgi:hypothetical protein